MSRPSKRISLPVVLLALVALCAFGLAADQARAFPNGQAPRSALAPIYSPSAGRPNAAPAQVLARGGPVEAWNTLNLCLYQHGQPLLYSYGDGAAYRALSSGWAFDGSEFTQAVAWYRYQHGGNLAAFPGTSNHGWGRAVDLGSPSSMRPLLDSRGPPLGWRWGEAPSEPWHVTHYGGFGRPDPGVSPAYPDLHVGAGGRCQANAVAEVQRRLLQLGFYPHRPGHPSTFNANLRLAVYTYQVARRFKHPTGTVTRATWVALHQRQAGKPARLDRAHATDKLAGLKHGDRGPAVRQLSVDLAYVRHHADHARSFYPRPPVAFFTTGLAGALRAWQADNHLPATGVYDLQSQKVMGTSVRYWHHKLPPPPAPKPAPRPTPVVAPSGSTYWADISGNNTSVNLAPYRASRHVLIGIKLTEGDDFRSDSAATRWHQARQLGLVRVAYDFARPSRASCTSEALYFVAYAKQLGWHRGDVATLDWEDPDYHGHGDAWVACWARTLNAHGVRAGLLYSYGDYARSTLSSTHFLGYWHAQYTGGVSSSTAASWAVRSLLAIQYTDGQYGGGGPLSFPGIGRSDGDRLVVSVPKLLTYAQR